MSNEQGTVNNLIMSDVVDDYMYKYGEYMIANMFPHIIDGLKTVIRRSLFVNAKKYPNYTATPNAIAKTNRYHIHSGEAIYKAMIRCCQDFSMLYPLFTLKGDYGSYSGDIQASARYTEIKLSHFAYDMYFKNSKMELLKYMTTEDLKGLEPRYLIPKMPMTLLMYSYTIGFGFTSKNLCIL